MFWCSTIYREYWTLLLLRHISRYMILLENMLYQDCYPVNFSWVLSFLFFFSECKWTFPIVTVVSGVVSRQTRTDSFHSWYHMYKWQDEKFGQHFLEKNSIVTPKYSSKWECNRFLGQYFSSRMKRMEDYLLSLYYKVVMFW